MKNNYKKLYAHGVHGTRVYEIWSEENFIHMIANGAEYLEKVLGGKAGRSLEQQIQLRIDARVRSKLDHGFVEDKENIKESLTNQLGYFIPMKAQHYKDQKNFNDSTVCIQPKMDGHRCLTNSVTSYSRGGKPIITIGDLTSRLKVPEGITLDGELYFHGAPLQTIASWAKRYQANTEKLQYWIYDIIVEDELDMSFKQRTHLLKQMFEDKQSKRIKLVETRLIDIAHVYACFQGHRRRGFEGSIVRTLKGKYEIGKRSKGLLKVKKYNEEEFVCVAITINQHGWSILKLEAPNGQLFKATAPGTVADKIYVAKNPDKFIGRLVTTQFAEYTKDGIPFQPVALRFREDL